MINLYYFTERVLQIGFHITLGSHQFNHTKSKKNNKPNYPELGIKLRCINKSIKELFVFNARFTNQNKFKYQTFFSARFNEKDEDNQVLDETDFFISLNINQSLIETDLDKSDIKSPLDHQIQIQEMNELGWRCDKINSMTLSFYKTGEINGRSFVKMHLRNCAILSIEDNDNFCFSWSNLASLHP